MQRFGLTYWSKSARQGRKRKPSDLRTLPLPSLSWKEGDIDASLDALFRRIEEQGVSALDWYLVKKRKKARWSKSLRLLLIVLVSVAAIIPIISLITSRRLDPEWSLVAIAGAASLALADRAFSHSASWARYLATSMVLNDVLQKYQLEWASLYMHNRARQTSSGHPDEQLSLLMAFSTSIRNTVQKETEQWTQELTQALDELRSRASSGAA